MYYINEGRHFDISDEMRQIILSHGFQFYRQYACTGIHRFNNKIYLLDDNGEEHGLPYDPDVFVH
jgi:hypothetical protein